MNIVASRLTFPRGFGDRHLGQFDITDYTPSPFPGPPYALPDTLTPPPTVQTTLYPPGPWPELPTPTTPSTGIQTVFGTEEFPPGTPVAISQLPSGLPLGPAPRVPTGITPPAFTTQGIGQTLAANFAAVPQWLWWALGGLVILNVIGGEGMRELKRGRRR